MSKKDFDSLFYSKKYRVLKSEERRLFDLLIEAGQKKRRFEELELEYQTALNGLAGDVTKMESGLKMDTEEIELKLSNLQEKINELNNSINQARGDTRKNRLRRSLGEYHEDEFIARRNSYRKKLMELIGERAWAETGMALVRKVKSNSEKIISDSDLDNKPAGGVSDPSSVAGEGKARDEASFSAEITALLPEELIGSDPERLLVPALHIKSAEGWERYPLTQSEISIGNIRNPENDIALYDPQVSRRHAKIIRDNVTGDWYFVDTNSTNSSHINNRKVEPKSPIKLANRDTILLGDTRIVLYIP